MDKEVGVVPVEENSLAKPGYGAGVGEYRDELVRRYHAGSAGLIDRLKRTGDDDAQSLIMAMIEEVVKETDHLLGNEMVATENGDLRDASVISYKRAEVLEKAIKAVTTKLNLEKESGIDIDSPSMMVVFRFFMSKVKDVFVSIEMQDEQQDLFFQHFGELMENWKKELRSQFDELKSR
jgi:hypothetical protein